MSEAEVEAANALQNDPTDIVIESGEVVTQPVVEPVDDSVVIPPASEDPEQKPIKTKSEAPKWAMDRINENQNKADRLAEELAKANRERAEALALLERQGGDKPATPRTEETTDIDALIEARAEQKIFNNDCNIVAARGQNEIPGFNDKLGLLRSIGVVNDDFLKDIFAVDKDGAHTILDSLSQDPERASIMVKMDSRRRISELTRMTMAQVERPAAIAAKPAAVSKVPAPRPVLEAARAPEDKAEDEMSDQEWSSWRKKQLQRTA